MNVLIFPFVKQKRKFVFPDDFGHGAHRPEITRRKSRKGIDVMFVFPVIQGGNDISRHVDQHNTMHAERNQLLLQYPFYPIKLFLIECVRQ